MEEDYICGVLATIKDTGQMIDDSKAVSKRLSVSILANYGFRVLYLKIYYKRQT